ncbi:MAG: glycosyltransferase [Verrucomicrobiales bacterium]|nr:glycosyltransferase [Verrucomicrobiales bacterium]
MNELRYAIIIPVQNEEEVLGATLDELQKFLPAHSKISVGLNACEDRSREICIAKGIVFGETSESGYGWGCMAAIKAVEAEFPPTAYLFFAGDGANDPRDLPALIQAFELGEANFIIGIRRFDLKNWLDEFGRALPNLILGLVCRALGGQFFHDLGPLRLIERDLFQKMQLREMVWGWTIEAQLLAAKHGEKIDTREVIERPRLAGQQKVSGVSMARSARVGWEIGKAAIRTKLRR